MLDLTNSENIYFDFWMKSEYFLNPPVIKLIIDNEIYFEDSIKKDIHLRFKKKCNLEGNHKIKKLAHSSWTLAVYNLTGRNNAYSVYFVSTEGRIEGYKLSIFANPIPTITYNFKF